MSNVLGRITTARDEPRGPDVKHRIRVKKIWLDRGETVEIELPRNLVCASCDGGGCDACGGAGAVSTRGRKEPPEIVQVTLPKAGLTDTISDTSPRVALRIPEAGGLAKDETLPRGNLLLTVVAGEEADPSVRKSVPSLLPPPPRVPEIAEPRVEAGEEERPPVNWVLVVAVLVALWIAVLVILRVFGIA